MINIMINIILLYLFNYVRYTYQYTNIINTYKPRKKTKLTTKTIIYDKNTMQDVICLEIN